MRAAVEKHRAHYDAIHVVYADCGTGGLLQSACAEMQVDLVPGPHCYAFFDGVDGFKERDEMTAFYLTDFLVRQFDAFVWKPLGLDLHPQLRDMYFGHYDRLVYLAQTDDPALDALAQDHAALLNLTYEKRSTGFGVSWPHDHRLRNQQCGMMCTGADMSISCRCSCRLLR